MNKSFERSNIRRDFALAFFFSVFLLIGTNGIFAQTSVSQTGIIMERVADDDVKEAERLNVEAHAEDEAERQKLVEQDLLSEAEDDGSIDELFGEDAEGDTDAAVSTPTTEIVKVDLKKKPVEFSGTLKAELGACIYAYPYELSTPIAVFNNTLKFVGRPATDFFVYGSFLTAFPEMDFGIYELYFDYTMFGLVDLSAGKRDISWGLSRVLDTNIIDDEITYVIDADEANNKKPRTTNDSKFVLSLNIPVFSYASIQGVARYETNTVTDISIGHYISAAGKIEASVKNFSFAVLGKRWASGDEYRYDPCVGLEVISTALGKNSNMFAQGLVHFSDYENVVSRVRWSTGVYKYFENPIMLGIAVEYQGIWGRHDVYAAKISSQLDAEQREKYKVISGMKISQYEGFQHLFAVQIGWSRFIKDKKWTFGVEWFHDYRAEYGSVMPVIKIQNIIKYTDLRVAFPIYYGSERKYGVAFEVYLNLDY